MTHSIKIILLACAATIAVSTVHIPALAAGGGGGGGGGIPSQTAPQYDPAVEYRTGIEALRTERWKDAEKAFKRVLEVAPRDPNSNLMMGLSKLGSGDIKGSRPYLDKAVKYGPDLVPARIKLGVVSAKLGDVVKAQAQLDWLTARAQTCAGTCPEAATLEQGIAEVKAAISAGKLAKLETPKVEALASPDGGDRAYLTAVSLINEHRYEAAIAALNQAQLSFGPHPDVLTYLGFANRKLKRYDVAEVYYRAALAIAPDHLGATEYYGELMLERGDTSGAKKMLARLDRLCTFGCAQADELRRWIDLGPDRG